MSDPREALQALPRDSGERADDEERARRHAQLLYSERMASMGALSGGLAHEINNPLASVLANLALLQQELPKLLPDSEHTRDLLEAVAEAYRGADRVAQIVRGLKVFSRGLDERRQPLDVARVAEQVLHLFASELRQRARVVRDFRPAPLVEASEPHLGQVLVNLILNAAQSIPEGDVDGNEVRVSVGTGANGEMVLSVRDTGVGMPPEVLARIFDPFFTTRPVGSGSGLGLSICHGIVSSLGGRIEAESAPERGSTFRVTLPPCEGAASGPLAGHPAAQPLRSRILLVEDDSLVAHAVRRTLARDHEVSCVDSGRAALEILAREPFELVISDLLMPEMTGMDLHAELSRTRPEIARRMIFLTGGAFTDAAREFLRRIPNPQIEKPFDPAKLRDLIRNLLS